MFNRKSKRVSLPQTQAEFDALAVSFLDEQGFPVNESYQAFFAAHVQSLPNDEDTFDPEKMAKAMRRARVNELAFFLIHPHKRPKIEDTSKADDLVSETLPDGSGI